MCSAHSKGFINPGSCLFIPLLSSPRLRKGMIAFSGHAPEVRSLSGWMRPLSHEQL